MLRVLSKPAFGSRRNFMVNARSAVVTGVPSPHLSPSFRVMRMAMPGLPPGRCSMVAMPLAMVGNVSHSRQVLRQVLS